MILKKANKKEKRPRTIAADKSTPTAPNDAMNTPVRDHTSTPKPTETEKEIYKQADNPLGNPDRK